jgi:hypothetical protein
MDSIHAGLYYYSVRLFERNPVGLVTRNVVNLGKEAEFLHYVLLLPRLDENKYQDHHDHTWTILGSEYERLEDTGLLQGVYDLPINQQPQATVATLVPDDQNEMEHNQVYDEEDF